MENDHLLDSLIQQKAENLANQAEIKRLKDRALALLKMVSDLTGQLLNANDGSALEDTLRSIDVLESKLKEANDDHARLLGNVATLENENDILSREISAKPSDLEIETQNRYIYLLENYITKHISNDNIPSDLMQKAKDFSEEKLKSDHYEDIPF